MILRYCQELTYRLSLIINHVVIGNYVPMPGTFGSAIGLIIVFSVSTSNLLVLLVLLLALSFITLRQEVARLTPNASNHKHFFDKSYIIIDEVIGQIIASLIVLSYATSTTALLVSFGLFRFFDILKIYPISPLEKAITHYYGIVIDDVIAGIMAGILTLILFH